MGVLSPELGLALHELSQAPLRPPIGLVRVVPQDRTLLGLQARRLEQVLVVSPRTVRTLRLVVLGMPFAEQVVEQRALQPPAYPRRRAQLSQLRMQEMPPERVWFGYVPSVPQLFERTER